MPFQQPPPAYTRSTGEVFIELTKASPPPAMPAELQPILSEREFAERMAGLRKLFSIYVWSLFEHVWIMAAVAVTLGSWIAAGVVTHIFVRRAFRGERPGLDGRLTDAQVQHINNQLAQGRLISMAIVIGTMLLAWAPLGLWKALGVRKIQKVRRASNMNDSAKGSLQVLNWRLAKHSHLTSKVLLIATLPTGAVHHASPFHPQAYPAPYSMPPPEYPPADKAVEWVPGQEARAVHDPVADSMLPRRDWV